MSPKIKDITSPKNIPLGKFDLPLWVVYGFGASLSDSCQLKLLNTRKNSLEATQRLHFISLRNMFIPSCLINGMTSKMLKIKFST